MAALPRCDELRRAANSPEWEAQFILYCHRAISEDSRLAREINDLCARVTSIIEERESFVDELDVLAERHVQEMMAKFMRETLDCAVAAALLVVSLLFKNRVAQSVSVLAGTERGAIGLEYTVEMHTCLYSLITPAASSVRGIQIYAKDFETVTNAGL
ncbi:hypothetical protein Tco_1069389 [Tanacetum coccineum]|uniref:Uncharacterized protein n=1 Tax=Tanacetum coccineum TaxID=301880 RepID=A0ABQ5HK91_9ASTR